MKVLGRCSPEPSPFFFSKTNSLQFSLLRAVQLPIELTPAVPAMQEQIVFNLQFSEALTGYKLNGYNGHWC